MFLERDEVESCSQVTKNPDKLRMTFHSPTDLSPKDSQPIFGHNSHWLSVLHSWNCSSRLRHWVSLPPLQGKKKKSQKRAKLQLAKNSPQPHPLFASQDSVNLVLVRLTCWFKCDIIDCELHCLAHQNAWLRHRLPALCCKWKYIHGGIMAVALKTYVKGAEKKSDLESRFNGNDHYPWR